MIVSNICIYELYRYMSIYIYELWKRIYSIHFGYSYLETLTFNLFLDTNRRGKEIREIKREQQ